MSEGMVSGELGRMWCYRERVTWGDEKIGQNCSEIVVVQFHTIREWPAVLQRQMIWCGCVDKKCSGTV